jgi:ribosomal protein S18 acetylase RimI-like enzyme
MNVHIRSATKEDYAALVPIARESQEKHANALPHIFRKGVLGLSEDYFLSHLESERRAVYVAEVEKSIVGYVLLELEHIARTGILVPRSVAFINDITVMRSYQRQGVGRLLFERCVEWAKAKRAESLELMVWEFNKGAIAFYERLGMETVNRTMTLGLE